jgi:hypothetical protein
MAKPKDPTPSAAAPSAKPSRIREAAPGQYGKGWIVGGVRAPKKVDGVV